MKHVTRLRDAQKIYETLERISVMLKHCDQSDRNRSRLWLAPIFDQNLSIVLQETSGYSRRKSAFDPVVN